MANRGDRMTPDRRQGGMSDAEKGKGKLHMLHEGEIILNRPTTNMLLKKLGISKSTAMGMSPQDLMKKVKDFAMGVKESVTKEAIKRVRNAPKRQEGGMARPARKAPARKEGGMSRPARKAPSRKSGGMASADYRAEKDKRMGNIPRYDTI